MDGVRKALSLTIQQQRRSQVPEGWGQVSEATAPLAGAAPGVGVQRPQTLCHSSARAASASRRPFPDASKTPGHLMLGVARPRTAPGRVWFRLHNRKPPGEGPASWPPHPSVALAMQRAPCPQELLNSPGSPRHPHVPLPEVLADGSDAQVPGAEVGPQRKGGPPAQEPLPYCRSALCQLESAGGPGDEGSPERWGVESARACPPGSLAVSGRQIDWQEAPGGRGLGAGGLPSFRVPLGP